MGEGFRIHQTFRDDVARVRDTTTSVTRANGCRNGKPRLMEVISELPLGERACRCFAAPEILVAGHTSRQAAPMIMAQHEMSVAGAEEIGSAAAACFTFQLAACTPVFRIEPGRRQIAGEGSVI